MVPQVLSIIHATFPVEERGKAFAIAGGLAGWPRSPGRSIRRLRGFGPMGPVRLAWRPIFLINVARVGLIGLYLGGRLIRESKSHNRAAV